jgi:hypothetical protein
MAYSSSPADGTELRVGVVPAFLALRDIFLLSEDFFLSVFGGIREAAILGLMW